MTDWPEMLPAAPLNEGFRETMADTLVRTGMDQGPGKTRRRGTAGVGALTLQYILSTDEMTALRHFHDADLGGGALAFAFSHPVTGVPLNCRFKSPPAFTTLNGGYFRAALEFEVLP